MDERRTDRLIEASEQLRMQAARLQAGVIGSIERFHALARESHQLRERMGRKQRRRLGGWWEEAGGGRVWGRERK